VQLPFARWHGIGNTYILIRAEDLAVRPDGTRGLDTVQVRLLCDPHFGLGSDGILVLGPSDVADIHMAIYNPDGSMAEMCGNGIRMAARFLVDTNIVTASSLSIATEAGIMRPTVLEDGTVRVDMGTATTEGVETITLEDGQQLTGRLVSMGNPHFVVAHEPEHVDLERVGPAAEHHPRFPNRSNIEFIAVDAPDEIRMRVWERGVGETLACGTGACAVGVTAVLDHGSSSSVLVHLPGGDLRIDVDSDLHVHMTGPAAEICRGTIDVDAACAASPYANYQEIHA
jgi:diaminopimelate epimerase